MRVLFAERLSAVREYDSTGGYAGRAVRIALVGDTKGAGETFLGKEEKKSRVLPSKLRKNGGLVCKRDQFVLPAVGIYMNGDAQISNMCMAILTLLGSNLKCNNNTGNTIEKQIFFLLPELSFFIRKLGRLQNCSTKTLFFLYPQQHTKVGLH